MAAFFRKCKMDAINSIVWSLIANGIGLLLPVFINTIQGKELVEDKPSNWFCGSFILALVALIVCQYTDEVMVKFLCNLIAGGSAYFAFLCFKVIYEKYEKLSLANSHDEEKKDNHNKPPNIEIRIVNVTRVKTQKAKKAKRN